MKPAVMGLVIILTVVFQTTLAPAMEIAGVRPDWVLVVAVFFALYAPRAEAVVVAWVLGISVDMMSIERMGLLTMTYASTAFLVNSVRDYLFLRNSVTHLMVTLCAGLLTGTAIATYRIVLYPASHDHMSEIIRSGVLSAMFTALWAPLLHNMLLKFSRRFGYSTPQGSQEHSGWFGRTRV